MGAKTPKRGMTLASGLRTLRLVMRRWAAHLLITALAAIAAAAGAIAPAAEGGLIATAPPSGCDPQASQPFAPWGDNANYLLMPGGSFERGQPQWSLSGGAYVGPGNEPFRVERDHGTRSLYLPAGATAISPTGCFEFGDWHARFFVRGSGPTTARLKVDVLVESLLGVLTVVDGGSVAPSGEWRPSPRIGMLVCNVTALAGTKAVALRFRAMNGNFQVDDVYIDPWKDF